MCLIKFLIKEKIKPDNIKDTTYQATLLDEVIFLDIKEEDIIKEIRLNYGPKVFQTLYYVYLSNHENKELIIYYFYLNTLKYNQSVIYKRNLKCVNLALKIAKHVGSENHKLKGFLRFRELNNKILYATIAPDNNILYLLSLHFKKRLPKEYFIVNDLKHNLISLYDTKELYILNSEDFKINNLKMSKNEQEIKNLWKNFYQTISIKERKNERCRRNFMPKKYWPYIIEMEDEL